MQVVVQLFDAETLCFRCDAVRGQEVKEALSERHCISMDALTLSLDGMVINNNDAIPDEFGIVLRGSLSIDGGKGGYGAMLKAMAKQSGSKKTTDFGACRDLSGRRLRHVNDEIVLQKWKEAREKGEKLDTEEITQTGIDMWYLPAPNWVDGFKKPDQRKKFMKGRKKTRMCLDWERARKDGHAPKSAPAWWGCPRGPRCEYAHGEAELPEEIVQDLREKRKQEQRDKANEKRLNYVSAAVDQRSDAEMSELIMAGLQAAKRMKTEDPPSIPNAVSDAAVPLYAGGGVSAPPVTTRVVPASSAIASAQDPSGQEDAQQSPPSCSWLKILSGNDDAAPASGSYAPPSVDMNGLIQGNGEEGLGSVAVSGCALSEGNWYFEVEVLSEGLVQIGVADDKFSPSPHTGDGVGDDAHSWSFDGARSCVWHNGEKQSYGSGHWSAGDVIGVYVSIDNDEQAVPTPDKPKKRGRGKSTGGEAKVPRSLSVGFSLNGKYLGDAFLTQYSELSAKYYSPVISVESGESARVNVGQRPFQSYASGTVLKQEVEDSAASSTFAPIFKSLDVDITTSITAYMSFYSSVHDITENDATLTTAPDTKAPLERSSATALTTDALTMELSVEQQGSNASVDAVVFDNIDIEDAEFSGSAESFHRFGLAHLKAELERRGLKSGGTLAERANRLFSVRGISPEKIDKKYKAKKGAAAPKP